MDPSVSVFTETSLSTKTLNTMSLLYNAQSNTESIEEESETRSFSWTTEDLRNIFRNEVMRMFLFFRTNSVKLDCLSELDKNNDKFQ